MCACMREGYSFTGPLRPEWVSPYRPVPKHIKVPEYADSGTPLQEERSKQQEVPAVLKPEAIERLRRTCRLAREVLDIAARALRVHSTLSGWMTLALIGLIGAVCGCVFGWMMSGVAWNHN